MYYWIDKDIYSRHLNVLFASSIYRTKSSDKKIREFYTQKTKIRERKSRTERKEFKIIKGENFDDGRK